MIVVIAGNPDDGLFFYGPYEDAQSIDPAKVAQHNGDFWHMPLEAPAGAPALSAAEWLTQDDRWVSIDGWRIVGPFAGEAAVKAWSAAHPRPRTFDLLKPAPLEEVKVAS